MPVIDSALSPLRKVNPSLSTTQSSVNGDCKSSTASKTIQPWAACSSVSPDDGGEVADLAVEADGVDEDEAEGIGNAEAEADADAEADGDDDGTGTATGDSDRDGIADINSCDDGTNDEADITVTIGVTVDCGTNGIIESESPLLSCKSSIMSISGDADISISSHPIITVIDTSPVMPPSGRHEIAAVDGYDFQRNGMPLMSPATKNGLRISVRSHSSLTKIDTVLSDPVLHSMLNPEG